MRFVQGGCVEDRGGAGQAAPHEGAVGDRAFGSSERPGRHVEAEHVAAPRPQRPHERLTQMP